MGWMIPLCHATYYGDSATAQIRISHTVATEPAAAVEFRYDGPTPVLSPLASGEVRTQVGLALLRRDTCNVVYVMWQLAPRPGFYVSAKLNPTMSLHSQCGAGGYRSFVSDLPKKATWLPVPEQRNRLHAELHDGRLIVLANGQMVWRGNITLPSDLIGPVGIRSDNMRLHELVLHSPWG